MSYSYLYRTLMRRRKVEHLLTSTEEGEMDISLVCRVCLRKRHQNSILTSVFSPGDSSRGVSLLLSDMLILCTETQVHENDSLPKKICKKCVTELRTAYNFKLRCEKSYNYMLSINRDNEVKIENDCKDITLELKIKSGYLGIKEQVESGNSENEDNVPIEIKLEPIENENSQSLELTNYIDKKCIPKFKLEPVFSTKCGFEEIIKSNKSLSKKIQKTVSVRHKCGDRKKEKVPAKKTTVLTECCMWKCTVCHKAYRYQYLLKSHEKSHYSVKDYYCKICNKYYTSEVLHKKSHLRKETFSCDVCSKTFPTKQKIIQHIATHDKNRVKMFKCDLESCEKSYMAFHSLQRHILRHKGMKNFLCHLCSKAFVDKYGLESHLAFVHIGVRKFKCRLCPKSFILKSGRNVHEKRHLNVRPYQCDICEKKFTTKNHLSRHMALHQQNFNYSCKFCAKRFRRSDGRRRHEIVSHGIDKDMSLRRT